MTKPLCAKLIIYILISAAASHNSLAILTSFITDSEGRLLFAATHSHSHTGGQCCIHGVSNCSQGAQFLAQSKAASAHPSGTHHSQLT